jgi:hypothetical protein
VISKFYLTSAFITGICINIDLINKSQIVLSFYNKKEVLLLTYSFGDILQTFCT